MTRVAATALFCLALAAASADQVRLKGGGVLEGQILEETPEGVTLKSSAGTFRVSRDRIEAVVRKAYVPKAPPPATPPPGEAEASTPPPVQARSGDAVLGEEPVPDPTLAGFKAKVRAAMDAFRSFDHSPEAEAAARSLLDLGKPVVPAILDCLDDAEPVQQKWLADILGLLKDPASANALLNLIHSDRPEVRGSAARALGILKTEQAVQPLINLLGDDAANVRLEAVQALSALRPQKAVPALVARLSDKDRFVSRAAYQALTAITGESFPADPEPWREWLRKNPIGAKEHKTLTGRPLN